MIITFQYCRNYDNQLQAGMQNAAAVLPGVVPTAPAAPPAIGAPAMVPIGVPSRVLQFENMVEEAELRDDEEYNEIVEDIEEECKKWVEVQGIGGGLCARGAGCCFVCMVCFVGAGAAEPVSAQCHKTFTCTPKRTHFNFEKRFFCFVVLFVV